MNEKLLNGYSAELECQPNLLCTIGLRVAGLCKMRRRAKARPEIDRGIGASRAGCATGYATLREKSKWPMAGASSAEAPVQITITSNTVTESPQYPVGELQLTGITRGRFIFG